MNEILVRDFAGQVPDQIVAGAFEMALGRGPDADELVASLAYLGHSGDRARSFLWALIAGSEFRFNH
jgi:hypothetical protein